MKFHAALALLGWVLMVPPRVSDDCPTPSPSRPSVTCDYHLDPGAPLNKWTRTAPLGSYDDCEDVLKARIVRYRRASRNAKFTPRTQPTKRCTNNASTRTTRGCGQIIRTRRGIGTPRWLAK